MVSYRPDLASALRAFDRRERGMVVGWALDNVSFSLGFEFRSHIAKVLPTQCVPVSADAFAAMDYEFRWLYGALAWSCLGQTEGDLEPKEPAKAAHGLPRLEWLNEDVDLLLAYAKGAKTELVMIEAKGFTAWKAEQVARKVNRHEELFGRGGDRFPGVCPHLLFAGPVAPKLVDANWAPWMLRDEKPAFIALPQPTGAKYAISRGKAASGKWRIKPSKWPGP